MSNENVVEFPVRPEPLWLTGTAACVDCRFQWIENGPVGTIRGLRCPRCGLDKGVRTSLVEPLPGEEYFRCLPCGSLYFYILRSGVFCANCGLQHFPFDDDPKRVG